MATELRPASAAELVAAIVPLIERLADLLADRVAERLAPQQPQQEMAEPPARRLLTLDELVELLPTGKRPETWRAWLYQRTRHNQIPGQTKIGGRLFFDRQVTLPWLETGSTSGRLDVPARASLHTPPMSATAHRKAR